MRKRKPVKIKGLRETPWSKAVNSKLQEMIDKAEEKHNQRPKKK